MPANSESTTVLKGDWSFEWQVGYQYRSGGALKGTKLRLIPTSSNSAAAATTLIRQKVVWGLQNWG